MGYSNKEILEESKRKCWIVSYTPLGDYESLDYQFETEEEANTKLDELKREREKESYFGFVAKMVRIERVDEK